MDVEMLMMVTALYKSYENDTYICIYTSLALVLSYVKAPKESDFIYIYVYIYIHIYTYTYTYMQIHIYTYIYLISISIIV
jgi:hypothetical protein